MNDNDSIVIPETLDGKPVIAIGTYVNKEIWYSDNLDDMYWGALYGDIKIPDTVKYIGEYTDDSVSGFVVDENNPYYASENGSLYTKDMKTLLFYSGENGPHAKISEKAEVFAPSNGLFGAWAKTLELGKNIKTIDTQYYYDESEAYTKCPFSIKGYKGTSAEKWAKENKIEFIVLD